RLENDLVQLFLDILDDKQPELTWSNDAVVGVVVAAKGYPGEYEKGAIFPDLSVVEHADIYHAGTAKNEAGQLVSNGGRLLLVTAKGETIREAVDTVYEEMKKIEDDAFFYRKDIAHKAFK